MSNFVYLDYDQAHDYVAKEQRKGKATYWEGWNIVSFRPNPAGFMRKDGAFINGKWGTKRTIKPNKFGKWRVSESIRRVGN
jgi:hypothetical protein